jgi:hypothetical protein
MYVARAMNRPYREKPLGQKASIIEKIAIGFSLILLVIGMIAGPLLLFSSLNPLKVQIQGIPDYVAMSLNVEKGGGAYQIPLFSSTKSISTL